jgi:hypothetical protein
MGRDGCVQGCAVEALGIDLRELLAMWDLLGRGLLLVWLAYRGRAEAFHGEPAGTPRLAEAAARLGLGLEPARAAVLFLLGEGEQGELSHLALLLAALVSGLPPLFRTALALPLVRCAARLLRENRGGRRESSDRDGFLPFKKRVLGRVRALLEAGASGLGPAERARLVRTEGNRLRQTLERELSRVELEREDCRIPPFSTC